METPDGSDLAAPGTARIHMRLRDQGDQEDQSEEKGRSDQQEWH